MNKCLFTCIKTSVICCMVALFFSCTTEEYITEEYIEYITEYVDPEGEFAYVFYDVVTIKKTDWKWDPAMQRFEASAEFPEFFRDEYDYGALVGNVFINENGEEKLQILPYIKTWQDGNITFTETISCALSFDKQRVFFYIQSSDLIMDEEAPQEYEFKVSIIFNFTY